MHKWLQKCDLVVVVFFYVAIRSFWKPQQVCLHGLSVWFLCVSWLSWFLDNTSPHKTRCVHCNTNFVYPCSKCTHILCTLDHILFHFALVLLGHAYHATCRHLLYLAFCLYVFHILLLTISAAGVSSCSELMVILGRSSCWWRGTTERVNSFKHWRKTWHVCFRLSYRSMQASFSSKED